MLFRYTVGRIRVNVPNMPKGKIAKNHGRKVVRIFPDSSWLISLINEKDVHHEHVQSCLGFLAPHHPTYYISTVVIMETVTGLIRGSYTTKQAIDSVRKFLRKVTVRSEKTIAVESVLKKYQYFAKTKKIRRLTTMDFYIVTEGMLIGARILTSDVKMYRDTKKSYRGIYLITDKAKKRASDLPRLVKDIVNNHKVS